MRSWDNYKAPSYLISAGCLIIGFVSGQLLLYAVPLVLLTASACLQQTNQRRSVPLLCLLLTALALPPDLSDDVFRYLWEGYVQTQGYSPYSNSPDSLLETIEHPYETRVAHPSLTAIYPPLAQYLFAAAALVSPYLWAWKLLLGLIVLGFAMHPAGRDLAPWLASPLILFEGFWGAHLDLLGLVPAFMLVRALKDNKPMTAALCLALMTALKLLPGLLLPACLLHFPMRQWPRLLGVFLAVLFVAWLPYLYEGTNLFASFLTFGQQWHFNNPLFPLLRAFMHHDNVRPVMAVCLLVTAASATLMRQPTQQRMARVWLALFVFSPTLYPWYLLWLIPFVHPQRVKQLHLAYAAAALSYLILIPYRVSGVWQESLWWLVPEWVGLLWCFQAIWRAPKSVVT